MAQGTAIAAIDGPALPGWSWPAWVGVVAQRARREGWPLRDVVVLLPHAHLLDAARSAWARHGGAGWLPRIETTATLAAALAPTPHPPPGAVQAEAALDRIVAASLLGRVGGAGGAGDGQSGPPPALAAQVPALVDAAQVFARSLAACAPAGRAHWLAQARALVGAMAAATEGAPGAQEAALLRLALEWAAQHAHFEADALFAFRPAAWIALQAGGLDALTRAVVDAARAAGQPVWLMDLDALALESGADGAALGCPALGAAPEPPAVAVCTGAEDEARRCAQAVADALAQAAKAAAPGVAALPVALIAEDRLLVRRVRALLESRGIAIEDETGWKLATTRAAASVMALLRAARPAARSDDALDALKACAEALTPAGAAAQGSAALARHIAALPRLEAWLRRQGWRRATAALPPGSEAVQALWQAWQAALAPLAALARGAALPLAEALVRLDEALQLCGLGPALRQDAAGAQLIEALQFERARRSGAADAVNGIDAAWAEALRAHRVDLQGLIAWVDGVLEERRYQPPPMPAAASMAALPRVVITPLARALLRPWHAVVFPGLDERHFGAASAAPALVGDGLAGALGMPTQAERRAADWLALRALVRSAPHCVLLRRAAEDGEPLAASPWLERLAARASAQGRPLRPLADTRVRIAVAATPTPAPRPVWRDAAVQTAVLSARAYERLRGCPYRFHVREALALHEADELDDTLRAADIGDWLHRALQAFHQERAVHGPRGAEADARRLAEIARTLLDDGRWNALDFLPDALDLPRLAAAYVHWQMEQEGQHWQVAQMEQTLRATLGTLLGAAAAGSFDAALAAVRLEGRIDRLDRRLAGGAAWRVVDYKTRSRADLMKDVAQPQEDTQLAFYAALLGAEAAGKAEAVQAGYLSLRKGQADWVAHVDVEHTAQGLLAQLVRDLQRLRQGHPLYALGEPPTCDHCEARGLCRRDHWSGPAVAADAA